MFNLTGLRAILFFAEVIRAGIRERGPRGAENPCNVQLRWNPEVPGESVSVLAIPGDIYDAVHDVTG